MKTSKLLLGLFVTLTFCVLVFLAQSTGPLLADGTVAPSAFQINVITSAGKDTQSAPKDRFTPLMRVAACLPAGASCNKDADCCTQSCTPMHHKCAGR
jgi:hypothetical protein